MKEAIFILLAVFALAAFTAFRYRRQLGTALQIWKMLRGSNASQGSVGPPQSVQLVKCVSCGTLVPERGAIRYGPEVYYCSEACIKAGTS